jgi:hypothetical protein
VSQRPRSITSLIRVQRARDHLIRATRELQDERDLDLTAIIAGVAEAEASGEWRRQLVDVLRQLEAMDRLLAELRDKAPR